MNKYDVGVPNRVPIFVVKIDNDYSAGDIHRA